MTANNNHINVNSEAYNTGYEAAKKGEPRSANPYCRGTIDAANWLAGWMAVAPTAPSSRILGMAWHGWLMRYSDASYIRPATAYELRDSICDSAEGVIEVIIDGEQVACYVEG